LDKGSLYKGGDVPFGSDTVKMGHEVPIVSNDDGPQL
jgi:hypothetical protein